MTRTLGLAIVLILLSAALIQVPAGALELYMRSVVLAGDDQLLLRDLVKAHGAGGALETDSLLARPLGFTAERLTLLPPRVVRSRVADFYSGPLVLVGGRARIIPVSRSAGTGVWFYSRLLEFIEAQEADKSGRVEIEILAGSSLPTARSAGEPEFTLVDAERRLGRLAGSARITYTLSGMDRRGGTLELWIHQHVPLPRLKRAVRRGESFRSFDVERVETDLSLLPASQLVRAMLEVEPGDSAVYTARGDLASGRYVHKDDVETLVEIRAGDAVNIRFRRGNILLELPGRAQGSGSLGEDVPVIPGEIHKRFTGTVTGPKEVSVDVR